MVRSTNFSLHKIDVIKYPITIDVRLKGNTIVLSYPKPIQRTTDNSLQFFFLIWILTEPYSCKMKLKAEWQSKADAVVLQL